MTSDISPPGTREMMTPEQSLAQAQIVIRGIIASQHDRPSLVAQIACEVGAEIVEGRIPPGHDLNTVELARRYDTSRTPVREALILLENEGLVDIAPRHRPRGRLFTFDEISEIYRTRAVLYDLMAAEATLRICNEDIEVLAAILERMRDACERHDVVAYSWQSVAFHDNNTRMSGNNTAKRMHDSLLLRTLMVRRLALAQPDRLERSLEDHTQLLRAYENRNPALASAILGANHKASLVAIESYFKRTGTLDLPEDVNGLARAHMAPAGA